MIFPEKKKISPLNHQFDNSFNKGWNEAIKACERSYAKEPKLVEFDYDRDLKPLFDDVYNRKIINHSELKEKCRRFGGKP